MKNCRYTIGSEYDLALGLMASTGTYGALHVRHPFVRLTILKVLVAQSVKCPPGKPMCSQKEGPTEFETS